jgi:LuxR family maltose regulon positive regulatory protein
MGAPLLATKLYVPRLRRNVVARPRLLDRLDLALHRRLTLVSAPAGFGKTTLLSEWLMRRRRPVSGGDGQPSVAWLSFDAEDNELRRFLSYLTAALATVAPQAVEETRNLLRVPRLPPAESVLTVLINGLCALPTDLVLVLDDYHVIEDKAIHNALTFLLDNLPPPVHLIISTRADPPLPLSRWRSRGMMVEIHADGLRFTQQESTAYLNEVMDLNLVPEDVTALNHRTEGWIVGLQMAALALQGKGLPQDATAFVQAFSGTHHFILDYLVEEVLAQQPEEVQTFLLRTSILGRLTGPLCDAVRFGKAETPGTDGADAVRFDKAETPSTDGADAVRFDKAETDTGTDDGQAMLEALDTANLFLVPLDDERRWYRYHHLFAEVLRARLQRAAGKEGLAPLHTRAAVWFEAHGWVGQAFKHAVAAQDLERAGRLIEENWLRMGHAGEMNTVLGWLESMPDEVVRARPMLSGAYAWVLWLTGHMDATEPYLDAADVAWEREEAAGTLDPDHVRWRAGGPALRTALARHRGHLDEAIHFARQTMDLAVEDDALLQSYGHLGLAHTYRELGDYGRSLSAYVEGMPRARAAGNIAAANIAVFYLSRVLQLQGHLQRAAETVREALQFAEARGLEQSPACGILHTALANLLCERSELQGAEEHALRGLEMARLGGHHELLRNGGIVLARLRLAQGDPAGALDAIREAEQATPRAEMPLASAELAAHKARIRLAQGDLAAAGRWAEGAAQRPGQDRGYTRQIEAVTLARVLLARGRLGQALDQLAACQRAAEESGGQGWAVEIGILRALAQEARGNRADALADLESALVHAEPEGIMQVFLDEGVPMAALLRRGASLGIAPAHIDRLLDAHVKAAPQAEPLAVPSPSLLVEPLTEREGEVLRLMAAGLSNREIADELVLAMGTVKAHLHNIYGKLGVRSRVQAAARARELQLL